MASIKKNLKGYIYDDREKNWSKEYAAREISLHKKNLTLDHPDGSVTTSKLADGCVTEEKIDEGVIASILENKSEIGILHSSLLSEINARKTVDSKKADKATTLSGYGIEDAFTKEQVVTELDKKADKATTLSGYGIEDAYTKNETDNAISEAIENIEIPESSNGVGKKYLDKGEIFNDYENNIADTTNSHASGGKTVASGHGFKVIETSDNGDGTGTYTLNNVTGLEKGMTYSVRLSTARYNAGKITNITGNVVTVDNFKYIALDDEKTEPDNAEEFNVHNYFMIVGRPDLGELEVGFNAFASGENTIVSDRDGTGFGRDNLIIGQYGFGHGRNNIVGYAAYGGGRNNKALGDFSCTFGEGNEALAGYSDARGRSTKAKGMQSVTRGTGTIATATDQVVIGRYNTEDTAGDYLFIIGNGDKNTRSNALTLTKYGELWVKDDVLIGEDKKELATKEDVNTAKSAVYTTYSGTGWRAFKTSPSSKSAGSVSFATNYGEVTQKSAGGAAFNLYTKVNGKGASAFGNTTIASGENQIVRGKYNIEDTANTYADIVGNGEAEDIVDEEGKIITQNRSNAYTLDWDGNAWFKGIVETDAIILRSSNKKFRITIDDDGTLKATEVSK